MGDYEHFLEMQITVLEIQDSNTVHLWKAYKRAPLNMNTGKHKQMPRGCSQPVLKNKPSSKELSVPPSLRSFWRTWVIH